MTLEDWKAKGSYFNYKNHNIFTIDEGSGEVLLLIHGFPTASWDWWKMWNALVAKYRVITLDMIGFGFSDKPRNYNYQIKDQATIIEALLKSKSISKVHILSHDYGDTVAQELLARYQERNQNNSIGVEILSVCFLNGGLFPETHQPLLIQKLLISPIGSLIAKFFTKKKLAKNFKKIFGNKTQPSKEEMNNFWNLLLYNNGRKVFHLLIRYMKERKQYRTRWVNAIIKTTIPIRLIDGIQDPISGQNIVNRYKELIPTPDVVCLEVGHYPSVEAPDKVIHYYLEFLNNQD